VTAKPIPDFDNVQGQSPDIRCGGWVHSNQHHTSVLHPLAPLERNLPEVAIERKKDSVFDFRAFQNTFVRALAEILPGPHDVMASAPKTFNYVAREILVCQKTHLCGQGPGSELVREVTRIGEAGQQIIARQSRIVGQEFAFRNACRQ
jgi:hypothetical protein